MKYGYVRVAAATPKIRVADCEYNKNKIVEQIKLAHKNSASVVVFPELSITGYTCGDLFLQKIFLDGAINALTDIVKETEKLNIISIVGLPVATGTALYNCAAVIFKGEILALVPKMNLPAYSEFYETRHFTKGKDDKVLINGEEVCILTNSYFACDNLPEFKFGVEICEDLWVVNPPSNNLAQMGANIIFNLSASDEVIGKADYRINLVKMQSAKLLSAYVYADAGFGESTTDMVFSGDSIIAENGELINRAKRYQNGVIYGDIDLQKLEHERRRMNTFERNDDENCLCFEMDINDFEVERFYPQTPFVPHDESVIKSRCYEILSMQSTGLATRLKHINGKSVVLGLSGGLDSTLALIICVNAFDMLGLDRKNIIAVTMPCFGTTKRTKSNAQLLAQVYKVTLEEVDISKAVLQHFEDINHDFNIHDVTFENSQARERTQVLMDIANQRGAFVIGTGDLSELALGWATYNGDHMSMYAVNSSIPKTLVKYLVAYEAGNSSGDQQKVLNDILDTPVSPELLPPKDGNISQKTEELVGPYELHDFFLYYFVRFGFSPSKIYYITQIAFKEKYSKETIKIWLTVFVKRFFSQQFKRSCLPDGPKVGSVTLSPRADFRMPSDASVNVWLKELENLD